MRRAVTCRISFKSLRKTSWTNSITLLDFRKQWPLSSRETNQLRLKYSLTIWKLILYQKNEFCKSKPKLLKKSNSSTNKLPDKLFNEQQTLNRTPPIVTSQRKRFALPEVRFLVKLWPEFKPKLIQFVQILKNSLLNSQSNSNKNKKP